MFTPTLRCGGRLLAVDCPRYAELVDKHAKADGPRGFLKGHLHSAVFRKRVKYAFCLQRVIDAKHYGETLWLFILRGYRVGAHQNAIADCKSRMEDLLAPSQRHLFCHGRFAIGEHKDDFAAKASFIKFESSLA